MDRELYTLIKEAKQGNKEAFKELITRYKAVVYRQAVAMLHDRMEAEDVSQEAFIKVYYSLDRLDSPYAFSSWLSKIVFNLCYDRIQKKKTENSFPLEAIQDMIHPESTVAMEQKNAQLTLEEAMQKLSPDHRAVVILRDLQGFSYDEIADILNIPVGTVKSRIHTARITLRSELDNQGGGTRDRD